MEEIGVRNQYGLDVVKPIVFMQTSSVNVQAVQVIDPRYLVRYDCSFGVRNPMTAKRADIKTFNCNLSPNLNFSVSKDDDWNIDINIHVNPKKIAQNIPKIIDAVSEVAKFASKF